MPTKKIIGSWLKSITPYSYTPSELADRLMERGIETESIDDRFQALAGYVVGEVLTCERHPNADKLSVCTVTTGGEPHTVVCGAPNVAAGQKIAFAPVGTYIATADFTIERRKLRGIVSEGMICSPSELGLSDDHDGILVLPPDAVVGAPLADLLGDVIYEIDVTPNRADCLSHLGIAREVASMTGETIHLPPAEFSESIQKTEDAIEIVIEDPELCPRYVARAIRGVTVGPSPEWLQDALRKLGLRPRNNIVDIASYVLFECGHPLHAFDYDRLAGGRVEVKRAPAGEKFVTLDGKEHTLPEGALMICDAEKPVAIAGVMGGANSEITNETVNVLIESAYFDPASIRQTAKRLGLSTDASFRYERGADVERTIYAANRAAQMILEYAGGEALAGPYDLYPNPPAEAIVELRFAKTSEILGVEIGSAQQMEYLGRLGFGLDQEGESRVMVSVPSWRADIFSEVDLVEEIARVHGYDNIPSEPRATVSFDLRVDPLLKLIEATRHFYVDNGFSEMVALQFTDPETAAAYGEPVEMVNALGRDTSALRTSLVPGMAKTIALNQRRSRGDLRLFEVGRAFRRGRKDQGVIPGIVEMQELAVALCGMAEPVAWDIPVRAADLYDLRGILDRYLERIGVISVSYRQVDEARWGFGAPGLAIVVGEDEVGRIGPIDPVLLGRHDVEGSPVIAVLDFERLLPHAFTLTQYSAPSKFPVVHRDISILVDAATANAAIEETIRAAGGASLTELRVFDLYQGKGIEGGKKSISYTLSFTSYEGTLDDAAITEMMDRILKKIESIHGGKLRGGEGERVRE